MQMLALHWARYTPVLTSLGVFCFVLQVSNHLSLVCPQSFLGPVRSQFWCTALVYIFSWSVLLKYWWCDIVRKVHNGIIYCNTSVPSYHPPLVFNHLVVLNVGAWNCLLFRSSKRTCSKFVKSFGRIDEALQVSDSNRTVARMYWNKTFSPESVHLHHLVAMWYEI